MSRVARLNAAQMTVKDSESWHADYKDSAYVYAGGLRYELTEGDVVCIFSQYGEVLDVNLIRDKTTGISKGFAFLRYEDQRSTILAVDNLSGAKVLGRSLKVDHVNDYKQPKKEGESANDWEQDPRTSMNVAPIALFKPHQQAELAARDGVAASPHVENKIEEDFTRGIDPDDPMFEYLVNERREAARSLHNKKTDEEKTRDTHKHRSRRHRSRSPRSKDEEDRTHDRDSSTHRREHRHSGRRSRRNKSVERSERRHRSRS